VENQSQHLHVTNWVRFWWFAGLYVLLLSLGCEFVEAAVPLNVVTIKTDDQRWDTLWAMPIVQEELVRHGVTFANAFVSTPLCCPERASFLAGGFYTHNTGVLTNELPNGGVTEFLDRDTLPVRSAHSAGSRRTVAAAQGTDHHWADRVPRRGAHYLCAVISGLGRDRTLSLVRCKRRSPPGITLDGVAGLLTGTPTQAGTFQVQIQVTDASVSPYTMQPQAHI
jgi:hypothetical protein